MCCVDHGFRWKKLRRLLRKHVTLSTGRHRQYISLRCKNIDGRSSTMSSQCVRCCFGCWLHHTPTVDNSIRPFSPSYPYRRSRVQQILLYIDNKARNIHIRFFPPLEKFDVHVHIILIISHDQYHDKIGERSVLQYFPLWTFFCVDSAVYVPLSYVAFWYPPTTGHDPATYTIRQEESISHRHWVQHGYWL